MMQFEPLEARHLLAITIDGFGLLNDDGASNTDLITSDPTVTGTVNEEFGGEFPDGFVDVEFDVDGDGFTDDLVTVYSPGESFIYNPLDFDPFLAAGQITIDYYWVQYDEFSTLIDQGTGESFTFTYDDSQGGGGEDEPEIEVIDPNNNNLTNLVGSFDFGLTELGTPVNHSYAIDNVGLADLSIISVSVPNGFELDPFAPPDSVVFPGQSTSFDIILTAESAGVFSGTASINNDDSDENPFDFTVSGSVFEVAFNDLQLANDTGIPDDLVTTDPVITGTVDGEFLGNNVRIDFDHFGTGDVTSSVLVTSPGQSFTYDPLTGEPELDDYIGNLDINYRYVLVDSQSTVLWTGNWMGGISYWLDQVQTPPVTVVNPMGTRTYLEDSEEILIDLRDVFGSTEDEELEFFLFGGSMAPLGTAALHDWMLRLHLYPNATGTASIVIRAEGEDSNDSARNTVRIKVDDVNDFPTVEQTTATWIVNEDSGAHSIHLGDTLGFADLEDPQLFLRYTYSALSEKAPRKTDLL